VKQDKDKDREPRDLEDIDKDLTKLSLSMIDATAKVVRALKKSSTHTLELAAELHDLADMATDAAALQLEAAHSAAHLGADILLLDRMPDMSEEDDTDDEKGSDHDDNTA
jgi:hypothetical protein